MTKKILLKSPRLCAHCKRPLFSTEGFSGELLEIDGQEAWYRLTGTFNAYNLLAVYAAAFLLGEEKEQIITTLSTLPPVRGRFEYIQSDSGLIGIVDYAHTPDALETVLDNVKEQFPKSKISLVFGCGGDRDQKNALKTDRGWCAGSSYRIGIMA